MKKKIKITPRIKATLIKRGIASPTGNETKVTSVNTVTSGANISRRIKLSHSRPASGKKIWSPNGPKIMGATGLAIAAIILVLVFLIVVFVF